MPVGGAGSNYRPSVFRIRESARSNIRALVRTCQRTRGAAPVADRIIENPIINSPYRAPDRHFRFDDDGITNEIVDGRRPSQYFVPVPRPRKRGQQISSTSPSSPRTRSGRTTSSTRSGTASTSGASSGTRTSRPLPAACSSTGPTRSETTRSCSAQREAAETAIYLAEAAQKAGDAWIRNQLNEHERRV